MIEMLGVLAIVGILSVMGISGYTKALNKHRLNRQTEQMSLLFSAITFRLNQFFDVNVQAASFIPSLKAAGDIPSDMFHANSNYYIYDSFNKKIGLISEDCEGAGTTARNCSGVKLSYEIGKDDNFELCYNMFILAQSFADNINRCYTALAPSTASSTRLDTFYGNTATNCSNGTGDCLSDLALNDILASCQRCQKQSDCTLFFVWDRTPI
jgi:type II secretory pathway pseudopilin PulG